MDQPTLTHLIRAISSRRALTASLAAVPLLGGALLADNAAAKRKRRPQRTAQAEKKRKKKTATYCINGQTTQIKVNKKSRKKLKQQGATPGACAATTPPPSPQCPPACPSSQRCCGAACVAGEWGNQTTFGSGPGANATEFDDPRGVAIAPDLLTAWIADPENNRIAVWSRPSLSSAWGPLGVIGSGPGAGAAQLETPYGAVISPDTLTLFIADSSNNRISVWNRTSLAAAWAPQDTMGGPAAGSGSNQLQFPHDVAVTANGLHAVIADSGNDRVSVWTRPANDPTGWANQFIFGGFGFQPDKFLTPTGVAVTADGLTVLVADTFNHRIAVWTRADTSVNFTVQTTFGSGPGTAPDKFNGPNRVALAPDALTAWVADGTNDRIAVWTRPNASSID